MDVIQPFLPVSKPGLNAVTLRPGGGTARILWDTEISERLILEHYATSQYQCLLSVPHPCEGVTETTATGL